MKSLLLASSMLLLAEAPSCEQQPAPPQPSDVELHKVIKSEDSDARFRVDQVGEFKDDVAYEGRRKIYEVRDTKTQRLYFGITGVGITEVGEHKEGSGDDVRTVRDER